MAAATFSCRPLPAALTHSSALLHRRRASPRLHTFSAGVQKLLFRVSVRTASQLRAERRWRQVTSTYSTGTSSPDFASSPIDVVAEVKSQMILVLGGSGFVGTAVCKEAVNQGINVISLSRSGRPSYLEPWVDQVTWVSGDVFFTDWDSLLDGVSVVVSTLGGIGTNEQMEKLNANANIVAVNAAKKAGEKDLGPNLGTLNRTWCSVSMNLTAPVPVMYTGVPKYIYISVHDYNLPSFALNNGYFAGKRKAEMEILSTYPNSGTILRPGFIYGKRRVNGVDIPLDIVGEPLEKLLAATATLTRPLLNLPASDLLLAPPTSVDDVAIAVVRAVDDDSVFGTFNIEQIKEMATA